MRGKSTATQVGTQSISPLYWAMKHLARRFFDSFRPRSGSFNVAKAMLVDLLMIRGLLEAFFLLKSLGADRDNYYYGLPTLKLMEKIESQVVTRSSIGTRTS